MGSLITVMRAIDSFNEAVGKKVAFVAIAMVLMQFVIVVLRYIFGFGSIMMQESILYMHSLLFMVGAGYTLLHNGHVRVDLFYREASIRKKALVDLFGVVFLLLPVCLLITTSSWGYVAQSWAILEGSKETSGIHALYLLKSLILVFCGLVSLQGISLALRSFLILQGAYVPEDNNESHESA